MKEIIKLEHQNHPTELRWRPNCVSGSFRSHQGVFHRTNTSGIYRRAKPTIIGKLAHNAGRTETASGCFSSRRRVVGLLARDACRTEGTSGSFASISSHQNVCDDKVPRITRFLVQKLSTNTELSGLGGFTWWCQLFPCILLVDAFLSFSELKSAKMHFWMVVLCWNEL